MRLVEGMIYGDKNVNRIDDSEVLNFVKGHLSDVKNVKLPKDFKNILNEQVDRLKFIKDLLIIDKIKWPIDIFSTCQCAPIYEPDWWNNTPSIKSNNNCYNYACNYRHRYVLPAGQGNRQPILMAGRFGRMHRCSRKEKR